jgi:chloramphenicol-sensitive protein RarD
VEVTSSRLARSGIAYALAAFLAWGLAPIYWKALASAPARETLAHRIVWSVPCLALLLTARRQWPNAWRTVRAPRTLLTLAGTTTLIGLNWFLFVWAINENRLLEASLVYFMNPLVNVLLGLTILRERLRAGQWVAVALATAGVLVLTARLGEVPWFGLALAVSFGFYGLLRKTVLAEPLEGLTVEVVFLFPFAVAYLVHEAMTGSGTFGTGTAAQRLLFILAGPVTVLPLLWFTLAARRLRYTTIGILQYLAPSGQFLLAVFLYHEPFTREHLVAFSCIWVALVHDLHDVHLASHLPLSPSRRARTRTRRRTHP